MAFLYCVLSANLAMLSTGLSDGWTSSFVPKMLSVHEEIRMTSAQSSWMDPLMLLGVIFGGMVSALIINRIGRKKTLLLTAPTHILSWVLIMVAKSPTEIMCSRALSGFGSGLCLCATAVYLSEIATVRGRGAICATQLFSYELGLLLGNIGGLFLNMKTQALICVVIPIAFTILFFATPETPYYQMLQGNYDMAQEALVKYRGPKNVEEEMKMIVSTMEYDLTAGRNFVDLFLLRSNRKSLMITLLVVFFCYMTGSESIHNHAAIIFNDISSQINERYVPILFGVVKVCNSILIIIFADYSRKLLLFLSAVSSAIATFFISAYYLMREGKTDVSLFGGVAVALEIIFTFLFCSPRFSFILAGELFTTSMKGYATAVLVIFTYIVYVATVDLFQLVLSHGQIYLLLFPLVLIDIISIFAIYYCHVPETEHKTFLEIQELLKKTENLEESPSRTPTLPIR